MAKSDTQYQRASEFIEGIGKSLDTIQGRDVLLHSFEVDRNRPMRGDKKTLVTMQISDVDDVENPELFHAWSDSLAEKFEDIPAGTTYPLLIQFERISTASGFRVWSFR